MFLKAHKITSGQLSRNSYHELLFYFKTLFYKMLGNEKYYHIFKFKAF